jgi:L-alanine-DL-glutamate epimerase-like enolase superfamily enzyme
MTGLGWSYGPTACGSLVEGLLAPIVLGRDPSDAPAAWSAMVAAGRNATRRGSVGYAISAMDCALWDLKARLLGVPLADLLGRTRLLIA